MVLFDNKQILAWGNNLSGQLGMRLVNLGINHMFNTSNPCVVQLPPDSTPTQIFAGESTSACIIKRTYDDSDSDDQ